MNSQNETKLIEAIRKNDEAALLELFELYRPMVEKSKRSFFFRDYDDADWEQEAMIVCHDAVKQYDDKKGKFSTFFKKQLNNRNVSLLRYRKAARRLGNELAYSLESLQEIQSPLIKEKEENVILDFTNCELCEKFFANLSDIELIAFEIELGMYNLDEIVEELGIASEKIKRARARAYKKFIDALFSE